MDLEDTWGNHIQTFLIPDKLNRREDKSFVSYLWNQERNLDLSMMKYKNHSQKPE